MTNERGEEFRTKLEALLYEYSDVTGPVYVDSDGDPQAEQPVFKITEWTVVTAWADMENGHVYVCGDYPPNMPKHHQSGLLSAFLDIVESS